MKVAVCGDCDGHFHAVDVTNRDGMWELITEILDDGDVWANRETEYSDDLDYKSLNEEEWMDFINEFTHREQMEIVELF